MRRILHHARTGVIVFAVMVLGLTAAMAIGSVALYERGYDRWIPDHERVFRLETRSDPEPDGRIPFTPAPLREMLTDERTDIQASVRLTQIRPTPVIRDDGEMLPLLLRYADSGVIPFFGLRVLAGDSTSALDDPDALILTEGETRRIFGHSKPLNSIAGQALRTPRGGMLTVRAIIADPPEDTHLGLYALGSTAARMSPTRMPGMSGLRNHNIYTYIRTAQKVTPEALSMRLNVMLADLLPQQDSEATAAEKLGEIVAVQVNDIHLGNAGLGEMKPPGDPRQVSLLMLIAGLLLILVFASYGSYRYGLLFERLRELGVRKCAGARRCDIFLQFGREGAVFTGLALGLALALLFPLQPVLQSLADAAIRHPLSLAPWSVIAISVLICSGGALASAIPAALVSRHHAGELLHGVLPRRRAPVRAFLIATQVFVASFLIFSSVLVMRQMDHMTELSRGISLDGRHVLRLESGIDPVRLATWINHLSDRPDIGSVTASGAVLPIEFNLSTPLRRADADEATRVDPIPVDAAFARTLGMDLIAGRWFDPARVADSLEQRNDGAGRTGSVVLDMSAVQELGYDAPEHALGRSVQLDFARGETAELTVIGVVTNVHWGPASDHPRPAAYLVDPRHAPMSVIIAFEENVSGRNPSAVYASWRRIVDESRGSMFDLQPLHARFAQLSGDIATRSDVFGVFTATTLAISLTGIFGYAVFVANKLRREVALRKICGADTFRLHGLVFRRLLAPVLLGGLCAVPFAWRYNAIWLENFASTVEIGVPEVLALTFSFVFLVPLATFWIVTRTVRMSPATVLHVE